MKFTPILAALLIGIAAPATTHAVCSAGYCEGVGEQVVMTALLAPSGDIWLKAPADRAALRCTLFQGYSMILKKEHPLFKESYATILTALASGKSWLVRVVEGSPICQVDYVMIYSK